MFKNLIFCPITNYLYDKGIERWNEPYDYEEQVGYCGPPDRCCIDCYICLTPLGFVFDIITFNSIQCLKS